MRIRSGVHIGVDPGTKGAISVVRDGQLIQAFSFTGHIEQIGINQLTLVDSDWLQGILYDLRSIAENITIETPRLTTYRGETRIDTICKLQQQVAQACHAAKVAKFQVMPADPENWRGYHGFFAKTEKEKKTIIVNAFLEWHKAHDPNNFALELPEGQLSGIADAWAIAQYVYQQPPMSKSTTKRKTSSKKPAIQQPATDPKFVMF